MAKVINSLEVEVGGGDNWSRCARLAHQTPHTVRVTCASPPWQEVSLRWRAGGGVGAGHGGHQDLGFAVYPLWSSA